MVPRPGIDQFDCDWVLCEGHRYRFGLDPWYVEDDEGVFGLAEEVGTQESWNSFFPRSHTHSDPQPPELESAPCPHQHSAHPSTHPSHNLYPRSSDYSDVLDLSVGWCRRRRVYDCHVLLLLPLRFVPLGCRRRGNSLFYLLRGQRGMKQFTKR